MCAAIKLPRILGEKSTGLRGAEELRIATHIDRRLAAVVEHGDGGRVKGRIGGTAAVRWRIALPQISRPLRRGKLLRRSTRPRLLSTTVANERLQPSAQGIRPGTCIAIASPPRKYKPKRKRRMASVSRRMESNRAAFPRQSRHTAGEEGEA